MTSSLESMIDPRLPDRLRDVVNHPRALGHLTEYYQAYDGRLFDEWPDVNDLGSENRITSADVLAVRCLSLTVPASVAHTLITDADGMVTKLLTALGPDRDVWDASANFFERDGSADQLWNKISSTKATGRKSASHRVTAYKLMAVKRPKLIPIRDKYVKAIIKIAPDMWWWPSVQRALRDGHDIRDRLDQLKADAHVPGNVSTLRILDVVLWRAGRLRATGR